jgi:hypothetical protein
MLARGIGKAAHAGRICIAEDFTPRKLKNQAGLATISREGWLWRVGNRLGRLEHQYGSSVVQISSDCRIQKCLPTVRIGLGANCAALALEAMKSEDSDSKTGHFCFDHLQMCHVT